MRGSTSDRCVPRVVGVLLAAIALASSARPLAAGTGMNTTTITYRYNADGALTAITTQRNNQNATT
jgi:YD repeat-containing protein